MNSREALKEALNTENSNKHLKIRRDEAIQAMIVAELSELRTILGKMAELLERRLQTN
jgi:hypothetical protein